MYASGPKQEQENADASSFLSTLAAIWRLTIPYFQSEDRWPGRLLLIAVIAAELGLVAINVLLNEWNNRFYNALQDHNWDAFVHELLFFCMLAAVYIVCAVYQLYLNLWLQIRWRQWMTVQFLGDWLKGSNHYRMQMLGDVADNPDQRITDDLKMFVDNTLTIGIGMLSSIVTLGSFVVILWRLSGDAPLLLFGMRMADSRLSRLVRTALCGVRHRAGTPHRPAADRAQFPSAALRGGFPLQPGAGARELRADRAARRRARRGRPAAGAASPRSSPIGERS